ncbi:hypothetical protein [Amycolatopsis speibonae]|uniref:Gp5/Type VI secretion system Vgr protein OB-fold domain-containing protein n=1 Tax=Amycolatopsis speibonae TaxID=1450224 RepID=A0ABV7PAK6_9PSEU
MSKSSIVNSVQVVSALSNPVTVSLSHCPMAFDLQPEGSFEVAERTPQGGYIEVVFDSYEGRPILWVHGWEFGDTEISVNGVPQAVPPCIRNKQPEHRLKGWPAGRPEADPAAGLFVSDERTEGNNRIDVEDSGTMTSHVNPPKQLIWYSGAGVNGGSPKLVLHDDGLRIIGAHGHVVTEAGANDGRE